MSALFEVNELSFAYSAKPVIRNLSLSLVAGRFYGIVGPNGCGKTTLLDLLLRHLRPAAGSIRFQGTMLSRYGRKALARALALVPQNFYVNFPYTAREIVLMGRYPHLPRFAAPSAEDQLLVDEVMRQTDTLRLQHCLITELSGGERQRVVFARALTQATPVLVLDEGTSNLDIRHTLALLTLARRGVAQEQRTVIAVMQDINLAAQFCDELVFMHAGAVVAHGTPEQVLTPQTLQQVFQVDASLYREPFSNALQVAFRY